MDKRIKFFYLSLIFFAIYIVISYLVNRDIFRNFDYMTMVFLQGVINRIFDSPFSLITIIGSSEATLFFLILIFAGILIKRKYIFLGVIFFFLTFIFELAGKFYIYHPKPPVVFFRNVINLKLPSGFIVDTHFSYPSGHTARIVYLITLISFLVLISKINKPKKMMWEIILIGFVFLVIISRIYLGEHWFSDVLGGILMGAGTGFLSLVFW